MLNLNSGRRHRPLPPSVVVGPEIPWVDPKELRPKWWQRGFSALGLGGIVLLLGVLVAFGAAVLALFGFFLLDYLVS